MMKVKTLFRLIPRFAEFLYALRGMRNQNILSTLDHLRLSLEWLLIAQRKSPDDGYSALYSLITGWSKGYIETTGYIIPTILDIAELLKEPQYKESCFKAGKWLLKVQQPDGSYPDIYEYEPQVFDTGQVLLGLNRLYRETKDRRYFEAARKSSNWLLEVQDADGSWATMGYYRGKASTYHSRVAAILIEFGQIAGDKRYVDAGKRNLEWTRSHQKKNGFFQKAELIDGHNPVLHTMMYVLEGFLMAYQLTGEQVWLDTLLKGAKPLKEINLNRDLVLYSQYDQHFNPTNREKCIPGLAQWAALCLDIYEITQDREYFEAAVLSIFYLKSKQLQGKGALSGALPASVPLWGYYQPLSFTNWGVKFFADALLKYHKYNRKAWEEQELWAKQCFKLKMGGLTWDKPGRKLEDGDCIICNHVKMIIDSIKAKEPAVLDLGCGKGRFIDFFQNRYPQWAIVGVDPYYSDDVLPVQAGSAYNIPCQDTSFDVVYTFQVLQHISDLKRALSEIRRVLKPKGILIIVDRDLVSGYGLLKRYYEICGKWMYPWDSPFLERWYTKGQWKNMLEVAGFDVQKMYTLNKLEDRGIKKLIGMNNCLLIYANKKNA